MTMTAKNEYGNALFLLSEEEKCTDDTLRDILTAEEIFKKNPEYVKLLDTPAVSKEERLSLIDKAFASMNENLKNLIKILCEKRAVYTFSEIRSTFSALYNETRGILHAEAISSVPMNAVQLSKMENKLSDMTGKTVIIKNTVDPSILGGIKLRYSGVQIDGSIKTRLDSFEKILKNTVI